MKIGIVAENYFPTLGGIQEHVFHLATHLAKRGFAVRVITGQPALTNGTGPDGAEDFVQRVGTPLQSRIGGTYSQATATPAAAYRFWRAIHAEKFDVLNIHSPCDPGLPAFATAMFKGPKVLTLHSYFRPQPWREVIAPYYRRVFKRASGVIAVSSGARDSMRRYADFAADVIPNGVDVAYWSRGQRIPHYADGRKALLYVGRMESRNGLDLLLEAFQAVASARRDVRLIVAGDGPDRERYRASVPAHLRDRVDFIGAIYQERSDVYASADLMVIPARTVGFSILVLEALAAGLPIVALPAHGVDQAGSHWSTVLLARESSAEALAEGILKGLEDDLRSRISEGRRISGQYDWSLVAPRIVQVVERVARAAD